MAVSARTGMAYVNKGDTIFHEKGLYIKQGGDFLELAGRQKKEKMQVLFEQWLSSDENWEKSKLIITMKESTKLSTFGCRKWFTKSELTSKYKSEDVAKEIILEKESADESIRGSLIRRHPDAPRNDSMVQYLCFDEDGETEVHDSVLSSLFEGVSKKKHGKHEKKNKKRKRSKRSTSSASSSESSSVSQSSSSSSNDKKKKKKKKSKGKKDKKGSKSKGKKAKGKETEKQKEARIQKEQKAKEREVEQAKNKIRTEASKALRNNRTSISSMQ